MKESGKRKPRSYHFILNNRQDNKLLVELRKFLREHRKIEGIQIESTTLHRFAYQFANTNDTLTRYRYPAKVITWLIQIGKLEIVTCYGDGSILYRITNLVI